jgi:hypothetical protein
MQIESLSFERVGELTDQATIEKHSLEIEGWDHEEGFRVPSVVVTSDGRVCEGVEHLRGLLNLGQDWIHDEDVQTTESFHKVLDGLQNLLIPVGKVNPDPENVRLHDERNLRAVRNSLKTFGQHHPLVVQREGMVVRIGNARLQSAIDLGWTHIAALVVDEGRVEAMARAIADNKTGELAVWDFQGLSGQLQELTDMDFDVQLIGFDTFEAGLLIEADEEDEHEEVYSAERPESEPPPEPEVERKYSLVFTAKQWRLLHEGFAESEAESLADWIVDLAVG